MSDTNKFFKIDSEEYLKLRSEPKELNHYDDQSEYVNFDLMNSGDSEKKRFRRIAQTMRSLKS